MVLNVNITMLYKKYCSLQPLNFTYKQTVILLLISQVDNSTNMSHTQQYLYELGLIWVACIGRYLLKLRNLWTVNVRRTLLLEQLEVVKNSKNGEDLSYWCPMERITNCWLSFIYIKKKTVEMRNCTFSLNTERDIWYTKGLSLWEKLEIARGW